MLQELRLAILPFEAVRAKGLKDVAKIDRKQAHLRDIAQEAPVNGKYYKISGKFAPVGLLTAVAVGVFGMIASSWIYGYFMAWVPLVYLKILGIVCFGLAGGGLTVLGVTLGKIRNRGMALILGLLNFAVGTYSGWIAWIFAMSSQDVFVWDPVKLFAVIQLMGESGVWSVRDMTPTGWALYICWISEALLILGFTLYIAKNAATNSPFCEDCRNWMKESIVLGFFEVDSNVAGFRRDFELEKAKAIQELEPTFEPGNHFLVASSESCESCEKVNLFSLSERVISYDKNGKAEQKDKKVIDRLFVQAESLEKVKLRYEVAAAVKKNRTS